MAMQELDRRNMDPEELLLYQVTMAKNAHAVQVVKKQIAKAEQDALAQGLEQGLEQGKQQAITATVLNLLQTKLLTVAQIAVATGVSVDFVLALQADENHGQ